MRSQLLVMSMISLAVSGCGKDVSRTATPLTQAQQQMGVPLHGAPTETRPGQCHDPIQTPYKKVERFSDIAKAGGSYDLKSFEAVGTAMGTSAAASISVIGGTVQAGGKLAYSEICRDLSAMPQGSYSWSSTAPSAIDAKKGTVQERIQLGQTVYGPAVIDPTGPRPPVTTLVRAPSEGRIVDVTYYQIDSDTIGVLRTSESSMNGIPVLSKIFARYTLVGGKTPTPTTTTTTTSPTKTGNGGQGNGGQGNGGQGTTVIVKPTTKNENGGQGNGGQGNGGQGSASKTSENTTVVVTSVSTTEASCCKMPETTPSLPTVNTVTTKTESEPKVSTKTKLKVNEVTVKNTVAGDEVTKTKLVEKTKTNAETGVSKKSSDLKVKETTPDSRSNLKIKIRVKTKSVR